MTLIDKHIVENYSGLFEGLSSINKMELIESLSKSLKKETDTKDVRFYKSFGAFCSNKSAAEIVKEMKSNRRFKEKQIRF